VTQETSPAYTIVVNARIATLARGQPTASAIAIRGEGIAAVGAIADLQGLRGPNTQLIDAGGRTVVPGLNDAHTHFIRAGSLFDRSALGRRAALAGPGRMRVQARRTPTPHWCR
jgi:predicted amidohydrolase YtcJ